MSQAQEHRLLAVLFQVCGQLAAGGGLTCSLKPHHQQHRKSAGRIGQLAAGTSHQLCELIVYYLYDLLAGSQALQDFLAKTFFFDIGNEFLDDLEVDIGFQQSQLNFSHGVVDVVFRQDSLAADLFKGILKFF